MRHGANALDVIGRVKARIEDITPSLPPGVEIVPTYDRSTLIERAMRTLKDEFVAAIVVVSLVILLFLWHIPSALTAIVTIPVAILLTFIPLSALGVTVNIMSLAGIAISIGVLVDGAIVEVENAYKRLEQWITGGRRGDYHEVRLRALQEVGPVVFFSLLLVAVAFLPVFTLLDQEGRLFKPLAYTKTLTMAIAALLAITLDPALRMLFTRVDYVHFRPRWLSWLVNTATVGRYRREEGHPISRRLFRVYEPACRWVLNHPTATLAAALALVLSAVPVYLRLGSEFMPPLDEGTLLFMPTTLPGLSVTEASRLLQTQDQVLRTFPEVERVFGKAGRAETATDPAPLSMMETTVVLKPTSDWRHVPRWYSWLPDVLEPPLRVLWPDRISRQALVAEMDAALRLPGVTNSWTMPIKGRTDMLSTGVRTPIGVKVLGPDLGTVEEIGTRIERVLQGVPGTHSAVAERAGGGYYLDVVPRREQLARYGLSVKDISAVITTAIGGEPVTTVVEGRERYTVSVRYPRELRDDVGKLQRVLVAAGGTAHVPLAQLAEIRLVPGPAMIRNENGMLAGYVYADVVGVDVGTYVAGARQAVRERVALPAGYSLVWSGQYESMLRVRERLLFVVPATLLTIFVLLMLNTGSPAKAGIVMLAVPFSLVGAVWYLWLLDYDLSAAVWVGMIALMGLDAETGVFMLLYLDLACAERARQGLLRTRDDLHEAIVHGAVKRVRPKLMTVCAAMLGLLPIMWSTGTGADMMKRVAAPMVGGLLTSFVLELLVYPPLYAGWKWRFPMRRGAALISPPP